MNKDEAELKELHSNLETDYENLGVAIEMLEEEIYRPDDECISIEKLKEIQKDLEGWLDMVETSIVDLEGEIERYQKALIVRGLK